MVETPNNASDDSGLKGYITRHVLMSIVLAVVVVIALNMIIGCFETGDPAVSVSPGREALDRITVEPATPQGSHTVSGDPVLSAGHIGQKPEESGMVLSDNTGADAPETAGHGSDTGQAHGSTVAILDVQPPPASHGSSAVIQSTDVVHSAEQKTVPVLAPAPGGAAEHAAEVHGADEPETPSYLVEGMAFVDAVIQPLDYELNQRFYGWRPNDILNVTDNVNNFQLGVLEVTRRTAVILSERISRTGTTASFDVNLQNAMNWFMIKADRYWFPSAESKYKAGLKEIRTYFYRLEKGEAQFYTRTDNLIPLLMAYQDLLGSCDENLVKSLEDDGSPVSYFKSDDYFFYAQGIASAMVTMLEGIATDFNVMVDRRGGMEVLFHAIESCHHAMEIDPWIILNSDLSSLFANHRLNMAAPISHARFYIGVLIKALST